MIQKAPKSKRNLSLIRQVDAELREAAAKKKAPIIKSEEVASNLKSHSNYLATSAIMIVIAIPMITIATSIMITITLMITIVTSLITIAAVMIIVGTVAMTITTMTRVKETAMLIMTIVIAVMATAISVMTTATVVMSLTAVLTTTMMAIVAMIEVGRVARILIRYWNWIFKKLYFKEL